MKIRNGFVSNSSSSSFIMIGCEITDEELNALKEEAIGRPKKNEEDWDWEDEAHDAIQQNGWVCFHEVGSTGQAYGKLLGEEDEGYFEDKQIDAKVLTKLFKEVKTKLAKDAKLIFGTRSC